MLSRIGNRNEFTMLLKSPTRCAGSTEYPSVRVHAGCAFMVVARYYVYGAENIEKTPRSRARDYGHKILYNC